MQPMKRMEKRRLNRTALVFLLLIVSAALTGCAGTQGNYGKLSPSQEVTDRFQAYEVYPDHNYYYTGPDAYPYSIIGIQKEYTLVSNFWKPVNLTATQLRKWINFERLRVGYDIRIYGANIVGPAGEPLGIWYAVRDWQSHSNVRLEPDNRVFMTTPDLDPIRGKSRYRDDWL